MIQVRILTNTGALSGVLEGTKTVAEAIRELGASTANCMIQANGDTFSAGQAEITTLDSIHRANRVTIATIVKLEGAR